jgi:hypothetical protein
MLASLKYVLGVGGQEAVGHVRVYLCGFNRSNCLSDSLQHWLDSRLT